MSESNPCPSHSQSKYKPRPNHWIQIWPSQNQSKRIIQEKTAPPADHLPTLEPFKAEGTPYFVYNGGRTTCSRTTLKTWMYDEYAVNEMVAFSLREVTSTLERPRERSFQLGVFLKGTQPYNRDWKYLYPGTGIDFRPFSDADWMKHLESSGVPRSTIDPSRIQARWVRLWSNSTKAWWARWPVATDVRPCMQETEEELMRQALQGRLQLQGEVWPHWCRVVLFMFLRKTYKTMQSVFKLWSDYTTEVSQFHSWKLGRYGQRCKKDFHKWQVLLK